MVDAPPDDRALANGDYGRISIMFDDGDICVKFKRVWNIDDNPKMEWIVQSDEIMKCRKGMTWEQIRLVADIIREV